MDTLGTAKDVAFEFNMALAIALASRREAQKLGAPFEEYIQSLVDHAIRRHWLPIGTEYPSRRIIDLAIILCEVIPPIAFNCCDFEVFCGDLAHKLKADEE